MLSRISRLAFPFGVLLCVLVNQVIQAQPTTAPASALLQTVGKPLVISGKTVDGKDFSTEQWKGKVVLVDFWATWCGPCVKAMPHVKALYDANHDKGFEIVGVSNDFSLASVKKFLSANPGYAWTQLFDPDAAKEQELHPIAKKLGIEAIPVTILIDKKGIVHAINLPAEGLDEAVAKLLAE